MRYMDRWGQSKDRWGQSKDRWGQSKITSGVAIANVVGDFTLTPELILL